MTGPERRAWVRRAVATLTPILRVDGWDITVRFDGRMRNRADCEAAPEYRTATVRFNLTRIPEEELAADVIHELLHIHIWSLAHAADVLCEADKTKREWVRVEEERLATTLEGILTPLLRERLA